jgi:hypothetical protein
MAQPYKILIILPFLLYTISAMSQQLHKHFELKDAKDIDDIELNLSTKAGKSFLNAVAPKPSLLVDGNKAHLDIIHRLILFHDALYRFFTGGLRVIAPSHLFHHQVAAARSDDFFSQPRCRSGPHFVVHKQAGPDERRITHASVHLPGSPAGGACARQVAAAN